MPGIDSGIDQPIDQPVDQGGDFPPLPPTGLTITVGDTTLNLSWTSGSPDSSTYNVYRRLSGSGSYALAGSPGSATTYADMGLTDGQAYDYYTTAVGANFMESQPSNIVTATPILGLPLAPAAPTATSGFATVSGTPNVPVINLTWVAPSSGNAPTGYNIYRGTTAGSESASPIVSNLSGLAYQDQTAAPGTTYYYYIKAVDGAGTGPASTEVTAKTACLPPVMNTPSAGDTTVTLTWGASTGASGYNVKRSGSAGGTYATIAGNISALTYTDTGLTDGVAYYYEVTALD